jgi:hypothetical protein
MGRYEEQQAKKRAILLDEARGLLEGRNFAAPAYLLKHMKISGAMAASLMRSLGFRKHNSRSWKREGDKHNG